MKDSSEFVDFYELLEISPNASRDTIERVFRYMAKRCHPDSSENADVKLFSLLVHACETLTNPESRALYDAQHERHKQQLKQLVEETGNIHSDCADRHRLLSLFYVRRRQDRRQPGIGSTTVEQIMQIPPDLLEFHLWYFREKGWIHREESGLLSITALGVDQIEARHQATEAEKYKRLEFNPSRPLNASPHLTKVGNEKELPQTVVEQVAAAPAVAAITPIHATTSESVQAIELPEFVEVGTPIEMLEVAALAVAAIDAPDNFDLTSAVNQSPRHEPRALVFPDTGVDQIAVPDYSQHI